MPPLCVAIATRPAGGIPCANEALSRTSGSVFTTPIQFGPIRRRPWSELSRARGAASPAPRRSALQSPR
jgi:hypothetical protein